jgi:hypothetical protein
VYKELIDVDIRYPLRPQPGRHGQEMWEDWLMSHVCGTEGGLRFVFFLDAEKIAI